MQNNNICFSLQREKRREKREVEEATTKTRTAAEVTAAALPMNCIVVILP
jgi:hypothetical protein